MDLLVLIFGIIGWIYNSFPLLIITIIISVFGVLLEGILLGYSKTGSYFSFMIFIAGIVAPLIRILQ